MAAPQPFGDRELAFLSALVGEGVEFLVVGLAAAALQGAPAVTQDVDLWFADLSDPRLRKALRRVGAAYVAPGPETPPLFAGGGTELFDVVVHMPGLGPFRDEAKKAVRVRVGGLSLPLLPLERIVVSKKATNRPKDRAILPALEAALAVERSRAKRRMRRTRGK